MKLYMCMTNTNYSQQTSVVPKSLYEHGYIVKLHNQHHRRQTDVNNNRWHMNNTRWNIVTVIGQTLYWLY